MRYSVHRYRSRNPAEGAERGARRAGGATGDSDRKGGAEMAVPLFMESGYIYGVEYIGIFWWASEKV